MLHFLHVVCLKEEETHGDQAERNDRQTPPIEVVNTVAPLLVHEYLRYASDKEDNYVEGKEKDHFHLLSDERLLIVGVSRLHAIHHFNLFSHVSLNADISACSLSCVM